MKKQCEALCETVETLGPDGKIHHPRWQCSNNGRYEHDGKMYCGTHHNAILRACKASDASKGVVFKNYEVAV